jgi:PAS domain S-box-containing protein
MPHGMCIEWRPELLLAHGLSDGLTAVAYFSIPLLILHIIRRRPALKVGNVYLLFVLFILACGVGHILDVWTIWHPDYYLQGVSKVFTALVSIVAAYKLWRLAPQLEKIPSIEEYEARNQALQEEIRAHIVTEQHLRQQIFLTEQLQETLNEYALVSTTDCDGTITYANARFCAVSGYTTDELLGQNHRIVNSGYHDAEFFSNLWRTIGRGHIWRGEIRNTRKNGTHYWVDAMICPMKGENNATYGFISVRREITDEVENRERLARGKQDAELMVMQILENLPAYASIKDETGRITYANPRSSRLFGKSQSEIPGHTDYELFAPESAAAIQADELKVLRDGVAVTHEETIMIPGSPEIRHVIAAKVPLRHEDGSIKGLLVIANDISQQKLNEQRIEELALFNQSVLDSLAARVCVIDTDGTLLTVNRAWMDTVKNFAIGDGHNYLKACLTTPSANRIAHQIAESLRQIIQNESSHFSLEYPHNHFLPFVSEESSDPEHINWYLLDAARFPHDPVRIVISHTDITERMRLGQQLKKREQLLATILDNMAACVYLKSADLQYLYANPQCAALFERNPADMQGLTDRDMSCESTARELEKLDRQVFETGTRAEGMEYFKLSENSSEHYLWSIKLPLRQDDESLSALLGISTDVTAIKRLEDERVHLLEKSAKTKSEFMANISHEIRTPMNSVLGVTELLQDTPLNSEQSHYLDILRFSCQHVLCLINDMLELSKIEAGHWVMEKRPFRLSEMLSAVLKTLIPLADNKGLQLIQNVSDRIPDHYHGSPLRIGQIITNLVGNAIKFTREGSITVSIAEAEDQATASEPDQIVLNFAVRDTGIGIPPQHQERIFRAFEQIESGGDLRVEGTGLGLTISSSLVYLMGGQLKVDSTEGVGSTFHFALPLQRGEATDSAENTRSGADISLKGQTLLLVEDNEINRELVEARLRKLDCTIHTAEHGQRALEILQNQRFDLILMDMRMPVMDGPTTVRLFRQEEAEMGWKRTPILALTANAHEDDIQACLAAGMDGHIGKPFTVDMLMEGIARMYQNLDRQNESPQSVQESAASVPVVFDAAAALDMTAGDKELFARIAGKFMERYPELLAQLHDAVASGNCELGRDASHTLKGNAGYLCAHELKRYAALLERLFGEKQLESAKMTLTTLEQVLERLIAAILEHQQKTTRNTAPGHSDSEPF